MGVWPLILTRQPPLLCGPPQHMGGTASDSLEDGYVLALGFHNLEEPVESTECQYIIWFVSTHGERLHNPFLANPAKRF